MSEPQPGGEELAARPTRAEVRVRKRRRRHVALIAIGVLVVAVPALVVVGISARSHAADARAREQTLARKLRAVDAEHTGDRERLDAARTASRQTSDALVILLGAFRTEVGVNSRAVEVANRAVVLFNSGQTAPAAELLGGEGRTAITELEQATAAVRVALSTLQSSAKELRSAAGG